MEFEMEFREFARTVQSALSSWSRTARLCVVTTVLTLDWILIALLARR